MTTTTNTQSDHECGYCRKPMSEGGGQGWADEDTAVCVRCYNEIKAGKS